MKNRERFAATISAGALILSLSGCSLELVIGQWQCKASSSYQPSEAGVNDVGVRLDPSWSTGFEDGFCDYRAGYGSCYQSGEASYDIVASPVHSGQYAAAFTVHGDGTGRSQQARCHLDGELPLRAYYSVWYFVPEAITNSGNWNLIHFQGGSSPADLHNLWDISLANNPDDGELHLTVYDQVPNSAKPSMSDPPPIPIGSWFHIEMLLKRAADSTGEIQVWQDDQSVLHATGLITDDSTYGQWYVGNWANQLNPSISTLYVDDVSLSDTR